MLFGELIAVYSENHVKPVGTLFGKNTELFIVKAGGPYTCHMILKC
jgi:hypothetical protein